jgi:arabinofuranan 3-O-arabinosyltransferase
VTAPAPAILRIPATGASSRAQRGLGYALLAALVYVPVLLARPGRVVADTKQYLYLDPGRVLERAWSMWDPNIGLGTVTHQNIGYLFPMGPWYLLAAGLGVLFLFRTLGLVGPGAVVGALAYTMSPYWLEYAARLSVLLLPWAGLRRG